MRLNQRMTATLLATVMMTGAGVLVNASAAHADPVVVIGYDSEGNPVYQGEGEFNDPAEPEGLSDTAPDPDAPETSQIKPGSSTSRPLCDAASSVTVTNLANSFKVDWSDVAINETSGKATIAVKAEVATTYTYGLSVSVTAEAKALIFAKVSGTINGSVSKSKMTTYGSTFTVDVPARTTVKVDRGMWQERFGYKYYSINRNCVEKRSSGTGQAPYKTAWKAYH